MIKADLVNNNINNTPLEGGGSRPSELVSIRQELQQTLIFICNSGGVRSLRGEVTCYN